MEYFGHTEKPERNDKIDMARTYWGPGPLPAGAEIIGGYSDNRRVGALIKLANGHLVCGYSGEISGIDARLISTAPTREQIIEARGKLGLTQTELGRLVDTALRTVQAWEQGRHKCPPLKWRVIQAQLDKK